jgi:hypothetical protein
MIILLTAHRRQNIALAVFWSAIVFDCHHMMLFLMLIDTMLQHQLLYKSEGGVHGSTSGEQGQSNYPAL